MTFSITLHWDDGEEKQLDNVERFDWSWQYDEALVMIDFADGSTDQYTGKKLVVSNGESDG